MEHFAYAANSGPNLCAREHLSEPDLTKNKIKITILLFRPIRYSYISINLYFLKLPPELLLLIEHTIGIALSHSKSISSLQIKKFGCVDQMSH